MNRALYKRGRSENPDAAFGVKNWLVFDIGVVSDVDGLAEKCNAYPSTRLMNYGFVLLTGKESKVLGYQKALEALQKQDPTKLEVVNGLLMPRS